MDDLLKPLNKKKKLEPGTIIRRIGNGKDQQGCFLEYDEDNNLILANILDMTMGSLIALTGVLKPQDGDKLFYYSSSFSNNPASKNALKIIKDSPIFKKYAELQDQIINFITVSYVPEQIIDMSQKETMSFLFVPVQQKFRIGRFNERRNPARVCNEAFLLWLESLQKGSHITYLALIMEQKHHIPRFYSAGTKPHEETAKLLMDETFNFHPTHGGHIKAIGFENGKKNFLVDAGSNYLGRGIKTPLYVSTTVTDALKKIFMEFEFIPVEGRGAFGSEQSYYKETPKKL
jgi:hypothetical protein